MLHFLDVHYHVAPDAFICRHGPLEAGQRYQQLGGAVVLKNHLGSCVPLAEVARNSQGCSLYESSIKPSQNTSSTCSIIDSGISVATHKNTLVKDKACQPTDKQTAVTPSPTDNNPLHDEDEIEEILHASSLKTLQASSNAAYRL